MPVRYMYKSYCIPSKNDWSICLRILVESVLYGKWMVQKCTKSIGLVFAALMNICSILSLWVFLAEGFAILMCCRICINKGYRNKCNHICLDSQVPLTLLASYNYNFISCIVWKCYSLLSQLTLSNSFTLYWVPGH